MDNNIKKLPKQRYKDIINRIASTTRPKYRALGLNADFLAENISDIEIWANSYKATHGFLGLTKETYDWLELIVEAKIFKLGSLQFEVLDPYQDEDLISYLSVSNCPLFWAYTYANALILAKKNARHLIKKPCIFLSV